MERALELQQNIILCKREESKEIYEVNDYSLVQKYTARNLNIIIMVPGVPVGYVSLKRRKY